MYNHLKHLRIDEGLTQREMANKMGVSLSMYEKVERGYIQASRNFINSFCKQYPEESIEKFFFNNKQHFECG